MTPLRAVIWCAVSTTTQANEEKESLPTQEAEQRAIAEREGWRVIEVLHVPGHSRRYVDIWECARDMQAEGINAFNRLIDLWRTRGFDVLICRDASRFARTQTLHSYVVESTIDSGARIYSLKDGMIDPTNYRMFISMAGYASAGEVDMLKRRHASGMRGRFKRGLSGSSLPFSHVVLGAKDEQRLELDRTKVRFWEDLKELLLAGMSYTDLPGAMAARGHYSPEGRVINDSFLWRLLHNPFTWGHVAYRFRQSYGAWAYDPVVPLPEGTEIMRNRIEPVWKGQDAEDVIAILRYRAEVGAGRRKRQETHRFTGLLICDDCGNTLCYADNPQKTAYYGCITRYRSAARTKTCNERRYIRESVAQAQIVDFLQRYIDKRGIDPFSDRVSAEVVDKRTAVNAEIAEIQRQIRNLVEKQAVAPQDAADIYTDQIAIRSRQLADLRNEAARLAGMGDAPDVVSQRSRALDDITRHAVREFMARDDSFVNQTLHRFMGRHRFVVRGGEIQDVRRGR